MTSADSVEIPPRRRLSLLSETGPVLRSRNFYPYLIGNMLSSIGTWFQTLGQAILIYRLTHSAFLLGVIGFAQYAAVTFLAPWTGSVADRFDRRRILITTQLAATGVTATLTVLVAAGTITPALLIVFAATLSVTNAFWTPTMMAFVPSLVEPARLSTALALNSVTFNVGRAVGPLLATLVIDAVGPAWAFGVNTCSYLAVVVGISAVHPLTRQVQPARRPRFRQSLRLVAADTRLAGLLLAISAMNLATDPVITLGPAFIVHAFHHQDSLAGLLVGAFGLGAVLAAFTVAYRLRGSRMSIAAALATTGVGMVAFSLSTTLAVALVMLFIAGFGYLCSNTTTTTRLQLEVSDEHRGRIMALWAVAFNGVRPIGSLVDGAIAAGIGLRVAGVAMALPALAAAAIGFASLTARRQRTR